jgi:hypothetical protein
MTLAIAQAIVDAMAATNAALLALGEVPPRGDHEGCAAFLVKANAAHAPLRALLDIEPGGVGRLIGAPLVVVEVWAVSTEGVARRGARPCRVTVRDRYGAIEDGGFTLDGREDAHDIVALWRGAVDAAIRAAKDRMVAAQRLIADEGAVMPAEVQQLHDCAMEYADASRRACNDGHIDAARALAALALDLERPAAEGCVAQPWKAILTRSAAHLALSAGDRAEAIRLAQVGIDEPTTPPGMREGLRRLIEAIGRGDGQGGRIAGRHGEDAEEV